jgi:hypothetical protein
MHCSTTPLHKPLHCSAPLHDTAPRHHDTTPLHYTIAQHGTALLHCMYCSTTSLHKPLHCSAPWHSTAPLCQGTPRHPTTAPLHYSITQHGTALRCTAQHCTALVHCMYCSTTSTPLQHEPLRCTTPWHSTAPLRQGTPRHHCTTPWHSTALRCTALHSTTSLHKRLHYTTAA